MRVYIKGAVTAAATLGGMLGIAYGVGSVLPARIEVTRSISINRPPENVCWVLTDYNSLALWHPQYRSAATISYPGEKPVRWRATYTDGRTVNVVVSEDKCPSEYAERISDAELPFSGTWKVEMARQDLTTDVTVHSSAVLRRPLDRLFVHLFVNPDMEVKRILEGLKRRVESATVKPTAATS